MAIPSNPGWKFGYVPSPGEWANTFSGKVDYPAPIEQGGTGGQDAYDGNYNLQQRQLISTNGIALNALTKYGIRTGLGAFAVTLPPLASLQPGDWIELADVDVNADVNNVHVTAAGADTIVFQGATAGSAIFASEGSTARLTVTGTTGSFVWSMVALTSYEAVSGLIDTTGALQAANNLSDLLNVYTALANLGLAYRVGGFFVSTPTATETLLIHGVVSNCTIPADFAGSVVNVGINPAASFVMTVYLNPTFTGLLITGGTVIGTITISTGGAVTFATTGHAAIELDAGEVIGVAGPGTADTTIACTDFTISAPYSAP